MLEWFSRERLSHLRNRVKRYTILTARLKKMVSVTSLQVLGHVLLLIVGVLGIFLGVLPDLRPDLANRPARFAALEAGLVRLGQFDYKSASGKSVALLVPGDQGYEEIYDVLRFFDSSLPPLEENPEISPAEGKGLIGVDNSPASYSTSGGTLPLPRFVAFQHTLGDKRPICWVRDLVFRIRDEKVRYWTRLGFASAFIAVVLDVLLGLWGLRTGRN
jgi:hypothetical protein